MNYSGRRETAASTAQIRHGDFADPNDTLAAIVNFHQDAVYGYFRKRQLQDSDAQDLTQEVFVRYHARPHDHGADAVRPFLLGIARNLLRERAKILRRRKEVPWNDLSSEAEHEGSYRWDEVEWFGELLRELGLKPWIERAVLEHFVFNRTLEEVAEKTGYSISHVHEVLKATVFPHALARYLASDFERLSTLDRTMVNAKDAGNIKMASLVVNDSVPTLRIHARQQGLSPIEASHFAQFLVHAGYVLIDEHRTEDARSLLAEARELPLGTDRERRLAEITQCRGGTFTAEWDFRQALSEYRKILGRREDRAELARRFGMAYRGVGRWDEARASLKDSIMYWRDEGKELEALRTEDRLDRIDIDQGYADRKLAVVERALERLHERKPLIRQEMRKHGSESDLVLVQHDLNVLQALATVRCRRDSAVELQQALIKRCRSGGFGHELFELKRRSAQHGLPLPEARRGISKKPRRRPEIRSPTGQ